MNERIRHLLYSLGVTANYTGFSYTVSAVELTAQDYDRLLMVTKWLYPEVASQFHTTMSCVERNIRTVAGGLPGCATRSSWSAWPAAGWTASPPLRGSSPFWLRICGSTACPRDLTFRDIH